MTRLWSYGVITVPARRAELPATLASLAAAGFDRPRLFVDGPGADHAGLGLPVTTRGERLGVVGNWVAALWELYVLAPAADLYAVFQDDVRAVRGLRGYLGASCRHPRAYWNPLTFRENERAVAGAPPGTWREAAVRELRTTPPRPDPEGRQTGLGALGLVFTRDGVQALLGSPLLAAKPAHADRPRANLDGIVVEAMNAAGWRELVHAPSLLGHAGRYSTVEPGKEWETAAGSFPGEGWDARDLLRPPAGPTTAPKQLP